MKDSNKRMNNKRMNNKRMNNKKSSNRNILIISIIGLALVLFMIFIFPSTKKNNSIKKADSLIEIENFEDGIAIYDKILTKDDSKDIRAKRDVATELMESQENYKKGIAAINNGEPNRAVKHFFKVSERDKKRYSQALEELENMEATILLELDRLVENDELDEAQKKVNSYLKISPRNVKMLNQKDRIDFAIGEIEKQAKLAEENKKKEKEVGLKADEERKKKESQAPIEAENNEKKKNEKEKKKEDSKNTASSLIGSKKSVIYKNANLRESPTLYGKIIRTLPQGKSVYIRETKTESAERIWCLVEVEGSSEVGWISNNTIR